MKHVFNILSVMPFIGWAVSHAELNETLKTASLIVGIMAASIAMMVNIKNL